MYDVCELDTCKIQLIVGYKVCDCQAWYKTVYTNLWTLKIFLTKFGVVLQLGSQKVNQNLKKREIRKTSQEFYDIQF
jgi:hypothetical protein